MFHSLKRLGHKFRSSAATPSSAVAQDKLDSQFFFEFSNNDLDLTSLCLPSYDKPETLRRKSSTHDNSLLQNYIETFKGIVDDVLEIILDYLDGHKPSLQACSLVCRHWHNVARPWLFRTFTVEPHKNVATRAAGWQAARAQPSEILVKGFRRGHMYTEHVADQSSYEQLAAIAPSFPHGARILTIHSSTLFSSELNKLSADHVQCVQTLLESIQTLRFDLTNWLYYKDFQSHLSDCPRVERLVLFCSQRVDNVCGSKPCLREYVPNPLPPAPIPGIRHLSLVHLKERFGYREGATRMEELLFWLVPNSDIVTLRSFTCVLRDMYMTHVWNRFMMKSCAHLRDLRVSFSNGQMLSISPQCAEWFPKSKQWVFPDLRSVEIAVCNGTLVCALRVLDVLTAPTLALLRLQLVVSENAWTVPNRALLDGIAESFRRFPALRQIIVYLPKRSEIVRRRFAQVERRSSLNVGFIYGTASMDPWAEGELDRTSM